MSYVFVGKTSAEEIIIDAKQEEIASLIDSLVDKVYLFKNHFGNQYVWKQDKYTTWEVDYFQRKCYRSSFTLTLVKKQKGFLGFYFSHRYEVPEIYIFAFQKAFVDAVQHTDRFNKIQNNMEKTQNLLKAIKS